MAKAESSAEGQKAVVVNIAAYHFTAIDDPAVLAATLRACAQAGALRGTVLVASEGVNLFLAGAANSIDEFVATVRTDSRLANIAI